MVSSPTTSLCARSGIVQRWPSSLADPLLRATAGHGRSFPHHSQGARVREERHDQVFQGRRDPLDVEAGGQRRRRPGEELEVVSSLTPGLVQLESLEGLRALVGDGSGEGSPLVGHGARPVTAGGRPVGGVLQDLERLSRRRRRPRDPP